MTEEIKLELVQLMSILRQKSRSYSETHSDNSMPRRRAQLAIRMDILRAILEGASTRTQIMFKADLPWVVFIDHLEALAEQGFVEKKGRENRIRITLTGKGIEVVGAYLNLIREIVVDQQMFAEPAEPYDEKPSSSDSFRDAFGIDGRRAILVARTINRERHKANA